MNANIMFFSWIFKLCYFQSTEAWNKYSFVHEVAKNNRDMYRHAKHTLIYVYDNRLYFMYTQFWSMPFSTNLPITEEFVVMFSMLLR